MVISGSGLVSKCPASARRNRCGLRMQSEALASPGTLPSPREVRMFTKTSPNGLVFAISSRPAGAILGDFDIDGSSLKPDHRSWLDRHVINPANARRGKPGLWLIDLIVRASQSGSDGHNRQLSLDRLRAVQSYLMSRMTGIPAQFFPDP